MSCNFLLHCLCPNRCACCSEVIYHDEDLCPVCAELLPFIPEGSCPSCGKPKRKCSCKDRRRTSFPCHSSFYYEGVVKTGLLTLKNGIAHGVSFFSHTMAQKVRDCYGTNFDGICYVPITAKKKKQRGYNQCLLLAEALSKELHLPVVYDGLVRLYDTEDQHTSHYQQRKGNVFGVFDANPALVAGKHLLLLDDIITTGATMEECGKMLYLAGCEEVYGITVASTKYDPE